ncbi:MAG: hypothetical protein BRD55_05245 [Bacteroidetes bacterium SW_9_63_38]|nr:MAG: hypothetical protein BRD55_05245 [Bacteroidetes bacterium SW_9_63_38]
MTRFRSGFLAVVVVVGVLVAGTLVGPRAVPTDFFARMSGTATADSDALADSIAQRLRRAHGADALASAPYLRLTFALDTPDGTRVIGRHLWDRTTGRYRVEWQKAPDSVYVALINVRKGTDSLPEGTVYRNGTALTGDAETEARRTAYQRFINDMYWLLAPLKVADPGVNRTYLPDSSTATHDVLHLTFGDVGLTPDDEYWLYISKGTGRLDRWAFHLQGMDDDAPPQVYDWTEDTTLTAPEGPVALSTRKAAVNGSQAILTTDLALPSQPPDGAFSTPTPLLDRPEN